MRIQPEDLQIPGLNENSKLIQFIESSQIQLLDGLYIGKSEVGGIGLYYEAGKSVEEVSSSLARIDLDLETRKMEEDRIILRIPQTSVLDYITLLDLLGEFKKRDQHLESNEVKFKESDILIHVLSLLRPTTETQIIICYLVGFCILRNLPRDDYSQGSPLRKLDPYLDILMNTAVIESLDDECEDPFLSTLLESAQDLREEYEALVQAFNGLQLLRLDEYLSYDEYYQANKAVRSRTLEIPHTSEEPEESEASDSDENRDGRESINNEEEKETKSKGDFYVNITLVPILDFANHSHNNNAYFDVDPITNDILLKLKSGFGKEKVEVTICYNPVESIQHFVKDYGFIPSIFENTEHEQVFELQVDLSPSIPNFHQVRKWMGVLPAIQLIRAGSGSVSVNMLDLPLLFTTGIEYNPEWRTLVTEVFGEDAEEVTAMISYQEEGPFDKINGLETPLGLMFNGSVKNEIDLHHSEILSTKAIRSIISVLQETAAHYITNNDVINDYLSLQKELVQALLSSYDPSDPLSIIRTDAPSDYSAYMSPPRQLVIE